jgi:hypothetical protein
MDAKMGWNEPGKPGLKPPLLEGFEKKHVISKQ